MDDLNRRRYTWRVGASRKPVFGDMDLYFFVRDGVSGNESYVSNIELTNVKGGCEIEPAMTLPEDAAQELMNELWQSGIRPSSGEGSVGQIGATEKHLEDMRQIAFGKLSIEKP